ncbi:MAG: DUF2264 domain-containing protein, partial [Anaerotignum sp.]|nr:DUF2264 domain-containing protein [Anaerotignum sp.]
MKRISKCVFIACFLLFLLAAMVVTVFSPKSSYSYYENRSLARPAPLTVETVLSGEFMKSISDCMRDHSAWREKALRANTWANIHILKKPVVNQVVIGDDILLPYLPYAAMDEEKVAANALEMTNRIAAAKRITEENGGKYYYMMLPFYGHQPAVADSYLTRGSMYCFLDVFAALGLSDTDEFWTAPAEPSVWQQTWGEGTPCPSTTA